MNAANKKRVRPPSEAKAAGCALAVSADRYHFVSKIAELTGMTRKELTDKVVDHYINTVFLSGGLTK